MGLELKKLFKVTFYICQNYLRLILRPRLARNFFTELYLMATTPGGEKRHQVEEEQRQARLAKEELERRQRFQLEELLREKRIHDELNQRQERMSQEEKERKTRYLDEIEGRMQRRQ